MGRGLAGRMCVIGLNLLGNLFGAAILMGLMC